jgi:hypothetical protein
VAWGVESIGGSPVGRAARNVVHLDHVCDVFRWVGFGKFRWTGLAMASGGAISRWVEIRGGFVVVLGDGVR